MQMSFCMSLANVLKNCALKLCFAIVLCNRVLQLCFTIAFCNCVSQSGFANVSEETKSPRSPKRRKAQEVLTDEKTKKS